MVIHGGTLAVELPDIVRLLLSSFYTGLLLSLTSYPEVHPLGLHPPQCDECHINPQTKLHNSLSFKPH